MLLCSMHAPALPEAADFLADTAVTAAGGGLYRIELSDRWNAAFYPFGGVVSAVALRAMQAELGERGQRLRTTTSLYVSPVPLGPLEVQVQTLRYGRRMSQLLATVRAVGATDGGLSVIAAFGEDREGFQFLDAEPPEVPAPEAAPLPEKPPPGWQRFRASFFEQLEMRPVRMNPSWRTDWQAGRAEAVRWTRFRRAPRLADGTLDPLALVAVSDTMPPAIAQKLGPGGEPWFAPSVDLTTHVLGSTREEWLLLRSRCRHASDGCATADNEIWSRDGRLLVFATQVMYLRLGPISA
jgi:acyl-CoA thioesterase